MVNLCPLSLPEPNGTTTNKTEEISAVQCNLTVVKSIPRAAPISCLLYIWMLLAMATSVTSISIFKPNPGLYIEKVGECQVKRGILRLQLDVTFEEMERDSIPLEAAAMNFSRLMDNTQQNGLGT